MTTPQILIHSKHMQEVYDITEKNRKLRTEVEIRAISHKDFHFTGKIEA